MLVKEESTLFKYMLPLSMMRFNWMFGKPSFVLGRIIVYFMKTAVGCRQIFILKCGDRVVVCLRFLFFVFF